MSHHMSGRSFTSDDDEPLYFTPTYKPEDLICEGSDTEANPRGIVEKRRRYEQCAERVLLGQLPIIQSAALRGPFYKDNKNEWINPWRHREGDWWKPGSKDMLFRREDVMRRAKEHGRNGMSPTEALAWCRRDAKRQAKEMGIDDNMDMDSDSATQSNKLVVSETIHEDLSLEKEGILPKAERTLGGPPLPRVPLSTFPTRANIEDSVETPIMRGSIPDKDNDGKELETWTGVKRPIDIAWLKGSHISKRARWEDPAVSSPTPLPHATSQKFQRKVTGNMTVAQNQISHTIQPRPGLSLETPRQALASRKSYVSLQQSDTTFDREGSFHTNIGQQGQQHLSFTASGSDIEPTYPYEDSPKPYLTVPLDTPAGQEARASQHSATESVTSPKLPSHHRIGAVFDKNHETPGNISFISDVAPSSMNLEHFQFRKKRRCKTDPTEGTNQLLNDIGEKSRAPLSEGTKPTPSVQRDSILSTPFILHPIQREGGSSTSQIRRTKVPRSKVSSARSSWMDESWLTTQEEVGISPSTMNSDSKRTIESECSPQYENFDNSWVTTQNDFHHAPASSASMEITEIYRNSNFFPRLNDVKHIDDPEFRGHEHNSSSQSSPLKHPSSALSVQPFSQSPHLPVLPENSNKSGVPMLYNNLDGSSTQSYNTSPVSSRENNLQTSQASNLSQNLVSSQQLPHRITTTREAEFSEDINDDNPECFQLEPVQRSDDNKGDHAELASLEVNSALEGRQIQDVTVLHASREPNIDMVPRANLDVSAVLQYEEDMPGVKQEETLQKEVQEAMRAERDADDGLKKSVTSSGQPSTSPPSAKRNNLSIHSPTSIQKDMNVNQILKSSMSKRFVPPLPSEDDVVPPASTQDLKEHVLEATAVEDVAIPSRDTVPFDTSKPDPEPKDKTIRRSFSPQSPWAPVDAGLMVCPEVIPTTETTERYSDVDSSNSGWQKDGHPATPDDDIIRPFRDLMTPSPPPEGFKTPEAEQRQSNTQLLVEAATQNPWAKGSEKKSLKRKRVSFGLLDDEDPIQSQYNSQRRRRSPSPESTYRPGASGSKAAEFNDDVTDMNSFQNHFSAIHRKSIGDDSSKVNGSVKRPLIVKYKTTISVGANLVASSPPVDAMAEAFIAADRDASRERERRLTKSPSPTRNSKRKSYITFEDEDEDEDEDDTVIQPSNSHVSTHVALNETSSNAKLGDHTPKFSLDEVEDFLGEDWSVEGELKKASLEFDSTTPRREDSVHAGGSLFAFENIWT